MHTNRLLKFINLKAELQPTNKKVQSYIHCAWCILQFQILCKYRVQIIPRPDSWQKISNLIANQLYSPHAVQKHEWMPCINIHSIYIFQQLNVRTQLVWCISALSKSKLILTFPIYQLHAWSFKINCSRCNCSTEQQDRVEYFTFQQYKLHCLLHARQIVYINKIDDNAALSVNIINYAEQSTVKDYIKCIHIADSSWCDLIIPMYNVYNVLITFNSHIQFNIQVQHYCNGYNKGCSILRYITIY